MWLVRVGETKYEKNYCDLFDKMLAAIMKTSNNSGMAVSLKTK